MHKFRNTIFVIALIALISACGSTKNVSTSGGTEAGTDKVESVKDRMAKPAEMFAYALSQNMNAHVNIAMLDVPAFSHLEPEKVKEVSQEVVAMKYLEPVLNKFYSNMDAVRNAFNENGYPSDSIVLKGYKIFEKEVDQPFPVVNLELESEGGKATVPVSFMDYNNKIYFLEILKTTNLFEK